MIAVDTPVRILVEALEPEGPSTQDPKARGFRSTRNLKAMVYLLAGKLDLRRAIAFQNAANSCRRKPSSHPARLNLPRRDPFDPSF